MDEFSKKLMRLDFDAIDSSAEVASPKGGREHFARYLGELLKLIRTEVDADRGFVALTGFEIGKYTPLAFFGYDSSHLRSLPTSGSDVPEALLLRRTEPLTVRKGGSSLAIGDRYPGAHQIHLNLIGHGEIIGLLCLDRLSGPFEQSALDRLKVAVPLLSTLIAEQNFSIRVHRLAQAFELHHQTGDDELNLLFEEIVELTALAFAADAVALRIYKPEHKHLAIEAYRGEINPSLLVERQPGEHVAGKLLVDPDHDWAAMDDNEGGGPTGMPISDSDREELKKSGVHACLVMRLASEASEEADDQKIGTLSYHMRRPHRFSWRDLVLFRSFCQRVADAIALERQTLRLKESKDDLEVEHMLLLAQHSQATNTDIITLIAHDLFHRSFHACVTLEGYMERVGKAIKKHGGDADLLHAEGEQAMHAATEIHATLTKLRAMQQSANRTEIEAPTPIRLKDLVDETENVLSGPLARNKITIRRNFADNLAFMGPRSIFGHVVFNLIINSIDAARTRASTRPMSIYITAKRESRGKDEDIVIQIWDEGPGINRQVFRDPNEVFDIGRTTKPNGTGTGLSVTRHLLQKHFGGSIQLDDPATALFRIRLPLRNDAARRAENS